MPDFKGVIYKMKLSTQEKIRLTQLLLCACFEITIDGLQQHHMMNEYMDTLDFTAQLLNSSYYINIYTASLQETFSDEYKEIKSLYDTVVSSVVSLMDYMGVEDPVAVFATYMYLYRHGYLSENKEFVYDTNMKDFAKLGGVDVIRGKGVCRSVASMLTDIYRQKGLDATNLLVNAKDAIPKIEKLCDKDKPSANDRTKQFVKVVSFITKYLPIANHVITDVQYEGKNYIFDPMNDGFLQKGAGTRLLIANNPNAYMTSCNFELLLMQLFGDFYTTGIVSTKRSLSLPTIDYSEYKEIYLETLQFCQKNIGLFDEFFHYNRETYKEISSLCDQQGNLFSRTFGVDPIQKTLKNIEKKGRTLM